MVRGAEMVHLVVVLGTVISTVSLSMATFLQQRRRRLKLRWRRHRPWRHQMDKWFKFHSQPPQFPKPPPPSQVWLHIVWLILMSTQVVQSQQLLQQCRNWVLRLRCPPSCRHWPRSPPHFRPQHQFRQLPDCRPSLRTHRQRYHQHYLRVSLVQSSLV